MIFVISFPCNASFFHISAHSFASLLDILPCFFNSTSRRTMACTAVLDVDVFFLQSNAENIDNRCTKRIHQASPTSPAPLIWIAKHPTSFFSFLDCERRAGPVVICIRAKENFNFHANSWWMLSKITHLHALRLFSTLTIICKKGKTKPASQPALQHPFIYNTSPE